MKGLVIGNMGLLLYQLKFIENIVDKIQEGSRYVLIKGKSGSGKSFALNHLESKLAGNQYHVVIFDGDYQYDDREYYPFKKTLFSSGNSKKELIAGGAAEVSQQIPVAGNLISYIIKSFVATKATSHNLLLNDEEQNKLYISGRNISGFGRCFCLPGAYAGIIQRSKDQKPHGKHDGGKRCGLCQHIRAEKCKRRRIPDTYQNGFYLR